ncbi:MAG: TetR/AcrR family transcriptional regulator [Chthoniobacterales bacterium]|nr:TetR/AcrR family transcriptional regulator [Chthoniobacterales bacterium]
MRVTRQQARENRSRVLRLAAQRFREKGLNGLGVAELMQEAGLTHGGFYKQFSSKDELAAEACAAAIADNLAAYQQLAKEDPESLVPLVSSLISELHRNTPGDGCLLASLGADIARSKKSVRSKVTDGVRKIVDCLSGWTPGRSKTLARRKAIATYTTVVGSLVVARAVDDPEFAREILKAARESLAELHQAG